MKRVWNTGFTVIVMSSIWSGAGCGKQETANVGREVHARAKEAAESTQQPSDAAEEVVEPASLHEAAKQGDTEAAARFLAEGIDIETQGEMGCRPLHHAVAFNQKAMVDFLLKKGADVNARLTSYRTPMMYHAVIYGNVGDTEIFERLILAGADVEAANHAGQAPLHLASAKSWIDAVSLFLKNGAKIQTADKDGKTALHYAGNGAMVKLLISRGADIRGRTKDGRTPLHTATSEETAEALLEHGAEVDARTNRQRTPLHKSAEFGDKRCIGRIEILIANGAGVEARDQEGNTPLHLAAEAWHGEPAVALLLEKGADIDAINEAGNTPLHLAATGRNCEPAISLLLAKGAKTTVKNKENQTPLDLAETKKRETAAALLRAHGNPD